MRTNQESVSSMIIAAPMFDQGSACEHHKSVDRGQPLITGGRWGAATPPSGSSGHIVLLLHSARLRPPCPVNGGLNMSERFDVCLTYQAIGVYSMQVPETPRTA